MNFTIRAYVSNGLVLSSSDDLFSIMYGICPAGTNLFYLLNPRDLTGFVPTNPASFNRNSGTKIKRVRVDILGAPGLQPGPFEAGGGETPALSGGTFTAKLGDDKKQITVPRFEEWFEVNHTFPPMLNVDSPLELDLQTNLPGSDCNLLCLYDSGNFQDFYKNRLCKGCITIECENSFEVSNV